MKVININGIVNSSLTIPIPVEEPNSVYVFISINTKKVIQIKLPTNIRDSIVILLFIIIYFLVLKNHYSVSVIMTKNIKQFYKALTLGQS